jgi:hypothetical protein
VSVTRRDFFRCSLFSLAWLAPIPTSDPDYIETTFIGGGSDLALTCDVKIIDLATGENLIETLGKGKGIVWADERTGWMEVYRDFSRSVGSERIYRPHRIYLRARNSEDPWVPIRKFAPALHPQMNQEQIERCVETGAYRPHA